MRSDVIISVVDMNVILLDLSLDTSDTN